MKTKNICISILCIAFLTACKKDLNKLPDAQEQSAESLNAIQNGEQLSNYAPNEILIQFKKDLPEQAKKNVLARITGTVSKRVLTRAMEHAGDKEGFLVIHTPIKVLDAVSKIKALPEVMYAEPNYIYKHATVSNDPKYVNGFMWGMYGDATSLINQYGSQAGEAWANGHTGNFTVGVGVIDEGAMFDHPDLTGNIKNPVEFKGTPGVDDDGNGYVDDVYGWDFFNNDNSTYDGITDDHGTHVSGTIGAKGGNGKGVAGVCWKIRMISAKFLGPFGGFTADAVQAVDYITDLKTRNGYGIVAINASWGGSGNSQLLYNAISRANDQNILFVAAAGNNAGDNDVTPVYPASFDLDNIIAVASITSTGALAISSNYGLTTVDLGAPGVGIFSTLPAAGGGVYGQMSGTSMAAPHVTGAAALYASTHPGSTAAQIKAAIINSAIATPSLQGITVTGGRLDVSGF